MQNFIDNKKVHEMVMVALEERWEAIRAHIHRVSDLVATIIPDGIAGGEFRQQDIKRAAECVMRGDGAPASPRDAGAMHGRP